MEIINTLDELLNLNRNAEYEIACDIDAKGKKVKCLCGDFSGKINGNGHTIKNLVVTDEIWGDEQTLALFYSMNKGEIRDISFENLSFVYERAYYSPRVAALVGSCSNSAIQDVKVTVIDSSGDLLSLVYEANDCTMINNKIVCNGEETPVAKYI